MPETGDSVVLTYTMHATAADTGWTITFPGRKPMAVQIMTMGDSIMTCRRDRTRASCARARRSRLMGSCTSRPGSLTGTTTAHYATTKPDSVTHLRMEGTKAP